MKKIIFVLVLALFIGSCTDKFEETNTNPNQISNESLKQDFNHLGKLYSNLLRNLQGGQIEEDLLTDSFVRHVGTPTPFEGNRNNTTYYPTWNSFWNRIYYYVMYPSNQFIEIAEADIYDVFSAWAKLIQVMGLSRLTAYHGPLIYSDYGSANDVIYYDSEPVLYDTFFSKLDEIQAVFNQNEDYPSLVKFDASYAGDVGKWNKLANSMRLRLAMRINKVAPALAKTQGEKAIADPAGLILSNADNFNVSLYGGKIPINYICFEWQDTRMGAGMEEFMVGLKDPRIAKYFEPATDETLYPEHPDYPYKGIASGAYLVDKDDRQTFSTVSLDFKSVTSRRFFTAAEVYFTLAEASLRGWAGAGIAKDNYEDGVRLSFANWGAGGVDAYLNDDTSTPIDYIDPVDSRNNYSTRSTITVAWNEADENELKLEKIITQKWINSFTSANEAWVDHRRTGYPKLAYAPKNDSNEDWGIIAADDFPYRWPFTTYERFGNPTGVADATAKLGGPDLISTPLWWDVEGPNF